MKHIKRKFNEQHQLKFDANDVVKNLPHEPAPKNIGEVAGKLTDNYIGYVFTDKNEIIKCFKYDSKKGPLLIPEPDPVLVYFNTAQINYRVIETMGVRRDLIALLERFKDMTPIMHNLYDFHSHSSSFAVFCFMAMESFVNKMIPDGHSIRVPGKLRTEEYDVQQIQQMELMKKIREVLPSVTSKNFLIDHGDKYQILNQLKTFRDEVVHTKKQVNDSTYYQKLFVTALNFDYSTTLYTVRDFINYYKPDLIEECNCGADF